MTTSRDPSQRVEEYEDPALAAIVAALAAGDVEPWRARLRARHGMQPDSDDAETTPLSVVLPLPALPMPRLCVRVGFLVGDENKGRGG